MTKPGNMVYTAQACATGGRDGHAKFSDGTLDVKLVAPKELGGTGVGGTNPEQMFAAGYATCFIAMKFVAAKTKSQLPAGTEVTGNVGLGPIPTGFTIMAELIVDLPGMEGHAAQELIDAAHVVCPYWNATRGNVDVKVHLA